MKILEMTATFGVLEQAVLRPGGGLTLIVAPNEAGKSTWAAFLRAMLYGFPQRDRDRAGYIAEKNRCQPWSGAAMEGALTAEWKGRELTVRRGPRGNVPWGAFSAVWTATGEPVAGMTAENCGELLLGISREVFERTAFVGQDGVLLSPSADLEKRIAALATAGEEEVSFSQVERRLKDWLNRRQVNSRVGLIPELEGELAETDAALARQGALLRQAQAARREQEELEAQKARLERQLQAHADADRARQVQRRAQARADRDAALAAYQSALGTAQGLPPAEELRRAQGDLACLNTLEASQRLAEKAVPQAREAAEAAQQAVQADACFGGMDPAQAAAKAQADHDAALRLQKGGLSPLSLLGAPVGSVLGAVFARSAQNQPYSILVLLLGALLGWAAAAIPMFLMGKSRQKKAAALLKKYDAQTAEDILTRAAEYSKKCAAAREAARQFQTARAEADKLSAQREDLTGRLLAFVRPFAPGRADPAAALDRALAQGEALAVARTRWEAAEKLLSSLPDPGPAEVRPVPVQPPQGDPAGLSAQLSAVREELSRAGGAAARLEGELRSLGDPAELSARRDALAEELERRREEYAALAAALDGLQAADSQLRERFSPAVNAKTGEYLSALTGGKYDRAALTRQFQALAQESGQTAPRRDLSLSAGTVRQLYLAARLAICDLALPAGEPCPLLLDDALDAFDDHRAKLALDCLLAVARRRQVLLFTCHGRERELLSGGGAAVLSL